MKPLLCTIGHGGQFPFPYDEDEERIEVSRVKDGKLWVLPIDKNYVQKIDNEAPECLVYRAPLDFFFQAEDGIRGLTVTGVQTCALPISGVIEEATAFVNLLLAAKEQTSYPIYIVLTMRSDFLGDCTQFSGLAEAINAGQIGRASCRERG